MCMDGCSGSATEGQLVCSALGHLSVMDDCVVCTFPLANVCAHWAALSAPDNKWNRPKTYVKIDRQTELSFTSPFARLRATFVCVCARECASQFTTTAAAPLLLRLRRLLLLLVLLLLRSTFICPPRKRVDKSCVERRNEEKRIIVGLCGSGFVWNAVQSQCRTHLDVSTVELWLRLACGTGETVYWCASSTTWAASAHLRAFLFVDEVICSGNNAFGFVCAQLGHCLRECVCVFVCESPFVALCESCICVLNLKLMHNSRELRAIRL